MRDAARAGSAATADRTMPALLIVCDGVTALRGDETVSFMVVFADSPDEVIE